MKIGKYISELLFENDFVILPQLGEFSTKYIPAKFIPELKKVESPSKIITFNDKNKSGGGLLTEYIARKENMSSQQSKEFVSNFVIEMLNSLRSGKKVELESVGVFAMDSSGSILFDPDKSINYLNDATGIPSVKEPEKKTEEASKTELDKMLDEVPAQPVASHEYTPEDQSISEEPLPVVEETKKEEPVKSNTIPLGQRAPLSSKRLHSDTGSHKSSSSDSIQSKEKKGGLPPALKWVALTVVPLLIIIIIVALNYEYLFGDKAVLWNKNAQIDQTETSDATSGNQQDFADSDENQVVQDQTTTSSTESFDPTVAPPAPERGRKVYYIIVGSFEEEHSAIILAEELRRKGARTADVFTPNRLGFYRVSYGYYYDLNEAESQLSSAKEINPDSWILHR